MKNLIKNMIATGTLASVALMPIVSFAQDSAKVKADIKVHPTFCAFIKDKTVDDFKKMGERGEKMEEKRDERTGVIAGIRAKIDTKRDDKQNEQQQKFDDLIAKWEANAKIDDEREALAEFKTALKAAIEDRNAAIDANVSGSRADKDAARAAAQAKIDAALATLENKIETALTKAQTDCTNGVPTAEVRANFAMSMKAALDAFRAERKSVSTETKTDIKTINDERKEENMEARTTFKDFWKTFGLKLKAAFGIGAKAE